MDSDNRLHEGVRLHHIEINLECPPILRYRNSLKDDIPRWQKKQGMGIYLSDNDHDCFTNMRFVDDVLLFASGKSGTQDPPREDKNS